MRYADRNQGTHAIEAEDEYIENGQHIGFHWKLPRCNCEGLSGECVFENSCLEAEMWREERDSIGRAGFQNRNIRPQHVYDKMKHDRKWPTTGRLIYAVWYARACGFAEWYATTAAGPCFIALIALVDLSWTHLLVCGVNEIYGKYGLWKRDFEDDI